MISALFVLALFVSDSGLGKFSIFHSILHFGLAKVIQGKFDKWDNKHDFEAKTFLMDSLSSDDSWWRSVSHLTPLLQHG